MTIKIDIDNGDLARRLNDETKAVENMVGALQKLDRASLNRVRDEIEKLKKSPLDAVRAISQELEGKLAGAFDKIGRIRPQSHLQKIADDIRAGGEQIRSAFRSQQQMLDNAALAAEAELVSNTQRSVRKAKTIAQQARDAATKVYEEMVAKQPNARIKPQGEQALYELMQAGAAMSNYHKRIAKGWAQSHKDFAKEVIESNEEIAKRQQESLNKAGLAADLAFSQNVKSLRAEYEAKKKLVEDTQRLREKSASKLDVRTVLGLSPGDMKGTAKKSAKIFAEMFALEAEGAQPGIVVDTRKMLRHLPASLIKSAGDSARVFNEAYEKEALRAASAPKLDPRTVLGLDMKKMEGTAKKSAKVFEQMFAQEAKGAQPGIHVDVEKLLNLPKASLKRSAQASMAYFQEEFAAEATRPSIWRSDAMTRKLLGLPSQQEMDRLKNDIIGRSQDLRAKIATAGVKSSKVVGDFTPYNAKQVFKDMHKNMDPKVPKTFGDVLRRVGGDMGYTHSMARGLTSGLGLLWLTWGSMVPLFTGAALSYGMMGIAKAGMEVETQLTKIKVLSKETTADVNQLGLQMLELAQNGPIGPKEIAEAMKTLSLAGLNASEVAEAIKPVLNFSLAGDTTIAKAADVISSVSTAFKLTAKDYNYVADVISVTAATSKASVETMGEAFKTASVAYTKFGVSLKDTALVMAMLHNVGVTGTAAGTAFRNMLTDMTARSSKSEKALRSLGMSLSDLLTQGGKLKPLGEVFEKMLKGLDKKSGGDQFIAIRDIFSERGDKGALEMFENIRRKASETGKSMFEAYKDLQTAINESSGFTILAAAEIGLTSSNAVKSVMSTLEATFVATFQNMRPYILQVSEDLKNAFASERFKSSTITVIEIVGTITTAVMNLSGVLLGLGALFLVIKGGLLLVGGITTAYTAWAAATTAVAVAHAAFAATPIGAILVGIGLAITGVIALWKMFTTSTDKARDATTAFAETNIDALLDRLKKEKQSLEDVNEARRQGITLLELQARAQAVALKGASTPKMQELEDRIAKYRPIKVTNPTYSQQLAGSPGSAQYLKDVTELERLRAEQQSKANEALALADDIARIRRDQDKATESRMKNSGGTAKVSPTGMPAVSMGSTATSTALQELQSFYEKSNRNISRDLDIRLSVLQAHNKAGLLADKEYQEQSFTAIAEAEAAKVRLLSESQTSRYGVLKKEEQQLIKQYGAAKVASWKSMADSDVEKITDQNERSYIARVRGYYHTLAMEQAKMVDQAEQVNDELTKRRTQSTNSYLEDQARAVREIGANLKKLEADAAASAAEMANTVDTSWMKPEKRAYAEAYSNEIKKWADNIYTAEQAVKDLAVEYAHWQDLLDKGIVTDETLTNYFNIGDLLGKAKQDLSKMKAQSSSTAVVVAKQAENKALRDEYTKFSDEFKTTMSDAISTALFEGGSKGAGKLRNYLEEVLVRRPFKIMIESAIEGVMGKDGLLGMFKWATGLGGDSIPTMPTEDSFSSGEFDLLSMVGGKASGGTVAPNSLYRVNENGIEMLSVGGKDYLMTGAEQGNITPAGRSGVNISYAPQIHIDSRTDQAQVASLVSRAVQAGNAKLVDDLRQARVI